jgi:hypothetical protein
VVFVLYYVQQINMLKVYQKMCKSSTFYEAKKLLLKTFYDWGKYNVWIIIMQLKANFFLVISITDIYRYILNFDYIISIQYVVINNIDY